MASESASFRPIVTSLWFRLTTLAIIALVFAEALILARGEAQGFTFYLTAPEVAFEVVVRLIAAALAGIALGSLCTAAIAPILWRFNSSRQLLAERAIQAAVVLVLFLDSRFALTVLIRWSHRGARFMSALLIAHFLTFVAALCVSRGRKELVTSLDDFLAEKVTRRTVIATGVSASALVATEFALAKTAPAVKAAAVPQRPKSNILLITFDAFCAEDMSLYGYKLPTTPNIDAFASKGTVFTNYYSASTFTTPCIAAMLTGFYPSESHVYQLPGRVRDVGKSLPHSMRAAGYATGAFVSSPYAYNLAKSLGSEYDSLPEPDYREGGLPYLWNATRPLHQESRVGIRIDEYLDMEKVWDFPRPSEPERSFAMRPAVSFQHAREVLANLPDGFFLWVHVMSPHSPYLPDAADLGRFIPYDKTRTWEQEQSWAAWEPHYEPDQQSQVNRRRLRYDEFIATADRAFGAFMSDLESGGKLRNTTVLVSADHGESFEGGIYGHGTSYLTRPVIHVPLIIRTPGQQSSRRCDFIADQTALAPTILDLGGVAKPEWMHGESLARWLTTDGQGGGEGLAFTQYFQKNSVYAPLRHGNVGVIAGRYQYVLDIATQKGSLRPLSEAHIWNLDRTAENPALAETLRAAIFSRFPDLPKAG